MKILSHRGYWKALSEKNTPAAFQRSFSLGFGTETDFRDHRGSLVVAHDIPDDASLAADVCFSCLAKYDNGLPLAVNIKADGLQVLLKSALEKYDIKNYFLFDMSVPDAIFSIKMGLRVFTRHSDVEPVPSFYSSASGVWMDSFKDDTWLTNDAIVSHLQEGKQVCIVSPELHKRSHLPLWSLLRASGLHGTSELMLCTDVPEEAVEYFKL